MTRCSRLHPYPAMLPDSLAVDLAARFVQPGDRVLDPFCGTGRSLVAAASRGAYCLGTDINPLACLVTLAKVADVSEVRLREFSRIAAQAPTCLGPNIERRPKNCTVDWFPARGVRELGEIVGWLNGERLTADERLVVGAVLSATTRDVSYARKSSWKLHRMSAVDMAKHNPSAWAIFARRLSALADELADAAPLPGTVNAFVANAVQLGANVRDWAGGVGFDVIITSPPYGDSRTTVQYGGISRLCLTPVTHLEGLSLDLREHDSVDRQCLGGAALAETHEPCSDADLTPYWKGGEQNEARSRVSRFLADMGRSLDEMAGLATEGGRLIMVIGRRLAGGRRLMLDRFVHDRLKPHGFTMETEWKRPNGPKLIPHRINSRGRANGQASKVVRTMTHERVIVLRRARTR